MRSVSRKQKINYVPNAQCIPSAPTLANTMLSVVVFVVELLPFVNKFEMIVKFI
jgi:hypothetical protein